MPDDTTAKMRLEEALRNRDFRASCLLLDQLHNVLDLMEHQSPTVLESLIDHTKELIKATTDPNPRREIREALVKYADQQLKRQREMERTLAYGITGKPDPDEK
jgi:hypothetical protein